MPTLLLNPHYKNNLLSDPVLWDEETNKISFLTGLLTFMQGKAPDSVWDGQPFNVSKE